ncbi:MAG TPA: NRDE family protein, partial [Burkholderiales bacterium]|nr:NRDE family protein [Burkholderiales bacterium]
MAANRDESYARPSAGAAFWDDHPDIYGGRDLTHGGTWLGLSLKGRFAALTNYRQGGPRAALERSRGELTRGFLTGVAAPADYIRGIEPDAASYNG